MLTLANPVLAGGFQRIADLEASTLPDEHMPTSFVVLDTEICNPIFTNDKTKSRHPRINNWAKDWNDYEAMGVACVVVWDYATSRFQVFTDLPCSSNIPGDRMPLEALDDYLSDKDIIAFKGDFDMRLLNAAGLVSKLEYRDVLAEVRVAAGLPANWSAQEKGNHRSFKLETLSLVNLGRSSGGTGKDCPFDWQYGRKAQVIAKCLIDVRNTVDLLAMPRIIDPNNGRFLTIPSKQAMKVYTVYG